MTQGSSFRLPRTVTPSRYAIELRLDPAAPTFDGTVDVAVTVHEAVGEIVLNGTEITVHAGALVGADEQVVEIDKAVPDAAAGRLTLELPSVLAPGEYSLRLEFSGRLSDLMEGMYRSRYTDDAGAEHVIITTHFEATDARRNFPCWDEPDLKASFALTLVVPEDVTALTNTPEIGREPADPGFVRRPVRRLDGDVDVPGLHRRRPSRAHRARLRGAGPHPGRVPARPHPAGRLRQRGRGLLAWTGSASYYGIPYPEQKLDQAAIPDFAQGAMENTGLVTYRETLLLLDPAQAAHEERLDVAETVAHELAHMWFGDLVDDALVERDLAERGVRDVHVVPLRRRDGALVARVRFVPGDPHDARSRSMRSPARGRSSSRWNRPTRPAACSTRSPTRRAGRSCG